MQSLEPAFYRSRSECGPRSHRTRDTFEVLRPKVLKLEQIAHELPSAVPNHDELVSYPKGMAYEAGTKDILWRPADA